MRKMAKLALVVCGFFFWVSISLAEDDVRQVGVGNSTCFDSKAAEAESAKLEASIVAFWPSPFSGCTRPEENLNFKSTDPIMSWVYFRNMEEGDTIKWKVCDPNGSCRERGSVIISYDGNWCAWTYWQLGVANIGGTWKVGVILNNSYLSESERAFSIVAYDGIISIVIDCPQPGAKVVGTGVNCGGGKKDCKEKIWDGAIELTAIAPEDWQFDYFQVGEDKYKENPALIGPIEEDTRIVAKFCPAKDRFELTSVESSPLGDRAVLILIHGENEGPWDWRIFATWAHDNPEFVSKYKLYTLKWDPLMDDMENLPMVGSLVFELTSNKNKQFGILAHGRGGILARKFMNYYIRGSGGKAGDWVRWLVTVGTPHNGTPRADSIWVKFTFNHAFEAWLEELTARYFQYLIFFDRRTNIWEDGGNELTRNAVPWHTPTERGKSILLQNTSLKKLNREEVYWKKIVPIGANAFKRRKNWQLDKILGEPVTTTYRQLDLGALVLASMPIIPKGYPKIPIDPSYRPFAANDGKVPLESALGLKPKSGQIFSVRDNGQLIYSEKVLVKRIRTPKIVVINRQDHYSIIVDKKTLEGVIIPTINNLP